MKRSWEGGVRSGRAPQARRNVVIKDIGAE